VPIFIYSRHKPRIDISGWPLVTYVTDVETAMADAKEAAGDKDVSVRGAAVAQLALAAGVLDELELHAHDPDTTGMLSAIVAPLAAGELPVWTAASYDGDLVLVPAGRLEEAADVLRRAGHQVTE
jgi:hypothetical protein